MLEVKKNNILINVFDDNTSILKYIKNTPRREFAKDSSEEADDNFSGTSSFKEAVDLLKYGDETLLKRIKRKIKETNVDKLISNARGRKQNYPDIVGFQANVPAYLSGNPLNMINVERRKENNKILNIYLAQTVHAGISVEQVEQVGSVYVATLELLEKLGYRCNLYLGYCVENSCPSQCSRFYMLNRIKTDREPLNIKKMAFPLCHASMFRRIGFAWIERCNIGVAKEKSEDVTNRYYGKAYTNRDMIAKELKGYLGTDFIIWTYQKDAKVSVENVLKNLEEIGIKIDFD